MHTRNNYDYLYPHPIWQNVKIQLLTHPIPSRPYSYPYKLLHPHIPSHTRTLSRLKCIAGGSCHKYNFCRDKKVFVATKQVSSPQKYANIILSRQTFCRNKLTFIATKDVFSRGKRVFYRDKSMLVGTKLSVQTNVLLWQAYFCVCRDRNDTRGSS